MYLPDGRLHDRQEAGPEGGRGRREREDAGIAGRAGRRGHEGGARPREAGGRTRRAADRWFAKAAQQAAPTGEIKKFYVAKARSARDKAAAVRRGEDVKQ